MAKRIKGFRAVLAWIHLIGVKAGGTAITLTMIFAGLSGSGIFGVITGVVGGYTGAHKRCNFWEFDLSKRRELYYM
jgi:pseudouridine-5'-phosphate glycosidase